MTTQIALALAGLVARLAAAAPPPGAAPDVRVEGDVTYQPGTGSLLVENGAVLRRGAVTVRSRSATYDPATGEVRATGGVLLTDPTRAVQADAIRAVLGGEWEAEGVVAFVKDRPVDLGAVDTIDAARLEGRNRLSFSGSRLQGEASGRFRLETARLTLCDCPGGCPPSWEVTATKADVVPGKRAILSWPVLRVTPRFLLVNRPVPVLALPWLYVPLGDRQTGLLLPEIRRTEILGFSVAEPLFVTLGRSADLTLTPEYAFGRARADVSDGKPAVRGAGARLELRWAPAEGAAGSVELAWLHDLDGEPGGEGGSRFAITGAHGQRISDRTSLAARLRLAGDAVWVRDLTSDVNGRQATYRRSDVLLSHRRGPIVLEAGAEYLQPLVPVAIVAGDRYGPLGADAGVASRWPGLVATLLPVGVGALQLSAHAAAARFAPVAGPRDLAGRPAVDRADARAELAFPLVLGGAVSLSPWVRGAAVGYAFEGGDGPRANAWGTGGMALGTELSRRFGSVRHAVAPRVEWRAGTPAAGAPLPWLAHDAFDRTGMGLLSSAPAGAWQQLRAAVETRLSREGVDLVRLEAGQDLDLRRGRFAETFVSANGSIGRVAAGASARFFALGGRGVAGEAVPAVPSRFLDRVSELGATLSVSDRRGDALTAGFFSVGPGGSGRLAAGLDPLFDLRPAATEATASASLGARVVLGGATLGYDAALRGRDAVVGACPGSAEPTRRVSAGDLQQQVGSFIWDSPCRCFRVIAAVRANDCTRSLGDVSYSASIDLSRFAAARQAP